MSTVPSSQIKTIALGSDHGGFELKEQLKSYLQQKGYTVDDAGTYKTISVDYPLFAYKVAQKVASGECQRGIVVDGAGIGSCMAANKVPGIRAAMCYDVTTAVNSREHNNANVLTLGGKLIEPELAKQIVDAWLATDCTEDRHLRRAGQILQIEKGFLDEKKSASAVKSNSSGGEVNELSNTDLEQIVQQITQMLKTQGVSIGSMGVCTCCGDSCGGHCAVRSEGSTARLHQEREGESR